MKRLYSLLDDAHYPSLDVLVTSIFNRIENELIELRGNLTSGQYTTEELSDQIDDLINLIIKRWMEDRDENSSRSTRIY